MDYKQRNAVLDAVPRTFFGLPTLGSTKRTRTSFPHGKPVFHPRYQNRAAQRAARHRRGDTSGKGKPGLVPTGPAVLTESPKARERREKREKAVIPPLG